MTSAITNRGTAYITGASSGIGAEYARQLAQQGYNLVLIARREDRLRELADKLQQAHMISTHVIVADLTLDEDVSRVVTTIQQDKNISMLINNAGFNAFGLFAEGDIQRNLDMMTLHMQTSIRLTHAVLPTMIQNKSGTVIMVSSFGSFSPLPHSATYGATKSFLNHFTEALSLELMHTGVVVQALCPGVTHTEIVNTPEFQSSGFSQQSMPAWMWMTAEQVVQISLSRIGKGNVLVIPGWHNKLMAIGASLRHVPILRYVMRHLAWVMIDRMRFSD